MRPVSILQGEIKGMARDFSLDSIPKGYVWDLVDWIPRRRSAKLEGRGPWRFFTPTPMAGVIWGGRQAPFEAGTKLLACGGDKVYEVDPASGAFTERGTLFPVGRHNGVMVRDRVYFGDDSAQNVPKHVSWDGSTWTVASLAGANTPKAPLLGAWRYRLIAGGVIGEPQRIYFSPLESPTTPQGPLGAWDVTSTWDTSLALTAIWTMPNQILCFHDGSIEKIRGSIPPGVNLEDDLSLDVFTSQMGTKDPKSIVGWQENVIFAGPRGVYITDGSTVRNLTDQGGIGDVWRNIYALKRSGTQVVSSVFLDLLFVTVLTDWNTNSPEDQIPYTFVCDLQSRSWWRFTNVDATCMIPSQVGGEEVWWGVDGINNVAGDRYRLSTLGPVMFGQNEIPEGEPGTYPDAIDGNGRAVLPRITTGWMKIAEEGVKRLWGIHVSHVTQTQTTPAPDVLNLSYKTDPYPFAAFKSIGDLPPVARYTRNRLFLGKRGYGVMVKLAQIAPTHVTRLYDIEVIPTLQDRGKL